MGYKPIVVFDFDGVVHSYTSGWKGITDIPDPPVEGIGEAIQEIRDIGYNVVIVSTRSKTEEGRQAILEWLDNNNIVVDEVSGTKPPAMCYIDDRAICFDGNSSTLLDKVKNFKTWMQKER